MAPGGKKRKGRGGATSADAPAPPDASAAPGERGATPPPGVTPSMAQFLEIKAANPDCMLFYRMGDFYELFFEDAVAAAQALGIVLTKRGKHLGADIPMCGVPIHRADEYLQRLIKQGFRVAVCEQLEDPARSEQARFEGGGAARCGAPRHARHADRGQPARRQGAQLSDRRVRWPQGGPRPSRHDCARLPRHLDRRVRGRRGAGGRLPRRDRAPLARAR